MVYSIPLDVLLGRKYTIPQDLFTTVIMKTIAKNRRARYNYEITDTIEAGIILTGQEVKSCRMGNIHLAGAYVSFIDGKPILKNAKIAPYKFASGIENYNAERERMLLLKKIDIRRMQSAIDEKGVSIIPLEVRSGRHIKVLLGLGRGLKKHDKRARTKEKEIKKRLRQGDEY